VPGSVPHLRLMCTTSAAHQAATNLVPNLPLVHTTSAGCKAAGLAVCTLLAACAQATRQITLTRHQYKTRACELLPVLDHLCATSWV